MISTSPIPDAAQQLAMFSSQPSKSPSPTATASAPPTFVPTWGLDRIDDRNLPLDSSFNPVPDNEGSGVTAYIVDTGIRISHVDFEGRASYGINTVDNNFNADDCNGHGTHVAGTVGGAQWSLDASAGHCCKCSKHGLEMMRSCHRLSLRQMQISRLAILLKLPP